MEKVTRTFVNSYKNKICVGYCELYYLLYFQKRIGYNSGLYGWNYDVFHIDLRTCIVTGYRPIGNISSYDLCYKYNEKAKNIIEDRTISDDEKREIVENLLEEFIKTLVDKV